MCLLGALSVSHALKKVAYNLKYHKNPKSRNAITILQLSMESF
jgi:hypothetical protein